MAFLSLSSLFYLFSKKEKLKKTTKKKEKTVEFAPPRFARNGFPYVCTNVFAGPNQLNLPLYEHCYRFFWLIDFFGWTPVN